MRRIKRLSAVPVALALTLLVTSAVAAGVGDNDTPLKSCFGIASGQRASTVGDTGEHASSFDEPRRGIGNLIFRDLHFSSIGAAGSFLAANDGILTTNCD
jgi:hypothetical protein